MSTDAAVRHSPWPALFYLWRRSLWNRWRGWGRRLRSPRYLVAFLLGLAYFGWIAFGMARPANGQARPGPDVDLMDHLLPLLAAILLGVSWVGSQSHRVLAFTPPEVQFLFQGPISRRTLLDYKLVRAQLRVLLLAAMFTIFGRGLLPLPWPLLAVSFCLVLATSHLHQVAAGLVRTSWTQHGTAGIRRHWLPLTIVVAAAAIMVATLAGAALALRRISSGAEFVTALNAALSRPAPALVLLPFRILIGPLLAPDFGTWAVAMLATLALWALHYLWIIRIDTAFEETAAKAGTELQAMMSAFREGRGFGAVRARRKGAINAPWFRLRPLGLPAVAIFWKNLTAFTRNLSS
ncbi:MAG TPA: putative ABC exporter domain-containing protein, partial [Longimicrobiales bacterium]|nr:putative ABC exporter domain-containing protein [Longimicrobiales bacterium]